MHALVVVVVVVLVVAGAYLCLALAGVGLVVGRRSPLADHCEHTALQAVLQI